MLLDCIGGWNKRYKSSWRDFGHQAQKREGLVVRLPDLLAVIVVGAVLVSATAKIPPLIGRLAR
jgi:hypothetical protein